MFTTATIFLETTNNNGPHSPLSEAQEATTPQPSPLQAICEQALKTLEAFNRKSEQRNRDASCCSFFCCTSPSPSETVPPHIFNILRRLAYSPIPVSASRDLLVHTLTLSECHRSSRKCEVQETISKVIETLEQFLNNPQKSRTTETQTDSQNYAAESEFRIPHANSFNVPHAQPADAGPPRPISPFDTASINNRPLFFSKNRNLRAPSADPALANSFSDGDVLDSPRFSEEELSGVPHSPPRGQQAPLSRSQDPFAKQLPKSNFFPPQGEDSFVDSLDSSQNIAKFRRKATTAQDPG